MSLADFKASVAGDAPPDAITPPLAALWWAAKGNWDQAHRIVQDESSREAAWVHAYLHRVEGDLGNAAYWYRQAGQPVTKTELAKEDHKTEWEQIASALLGSGRT